ncbi:ATP-binding cassette domain-containing protein [Photobacterium kasasachensis]|uniref:ATP-binding cassette domain-containing protein n=1 Tax=Photobacterium kasasachensis TaxID=2910240 RepID=UPI003D0993E0
MTLIHSPILAQSLAVSHNNGEQLFSNISFSLGSQITGLVGRNGVGKSVLASVLVGDRIPESGKVVCNAKVGYLSQITQNQERRELGTIADFLGMSAKLKALARIELGSCEQADFDLVGDDWGARDALCLQLQKMGLPPEPFKPCCGLSGGELTRLMLWQLFGADYDYLILDEPSNHLDRAGRQWLVEQMCAFDGGILLISHDRLLLEHVDEIMELTAEGVRHYGGTYTSYARQKELQHAAIERSVVNAEKQVLQIRKQYQRNMEKAQQRAAQGNKLRQSGSQSKLLLDGMRQSAQLSASARKVQFANQLSQAEQKASELKAQFEQVKPQQLVINQSERRASSVLALVAMKLRYGEGSAINLFLQYGDRLHLTGSNGCGKSTLLKTITSELTPVAGHMSCAAQLCYLDQHFSLLDEQQTVLENLQRLCPVCSNTELRTMAAGVGFRRERVNLSLSALSGGERMKVAMLVVSHQEGETLLLLDEPDNHLDLGSKQILAQALATYRGSLILISHDDCFVKEVGITRTLALGENKESGPEKATFSEYGSY